MLEEYVFYPPANHADAAYFLLPLYQQLPPLVLPGPAPSPRARSLTLLPELQQGGRVGGITGFLLRITAVDPSRMDPRVFVYVAKPARPGGAERELEFQRVAGPDDLASIPPDAPADGANPPYARLDYVELQFYSRAEAIEIRDAIAADVSDLLQALLDADDLDPGEPIVLTLG